MSLHNISEKPPISAHGAVVGFEPLVFPRKALIRKRGRTTIKPSDRLILTVQFSIYMLLALVTLEMAHIALLGSWNSEIFSAITGIAGSIFGVLFERRG